MGWGSGTGRNKRTGKERAKAGLQMAKKLTISIPSGKISNMKKVEALKGVYKTRIRKGQCPWCSKTMNKPGYMHTKCAKEMCESEADQYIVNTDVDNNPVEPYTSDGRKKINIRWDEPGFKW
jgi:tRNA U54 and U55 pseudouridine synthase Pus10